MLYNTGVQSFDLDELRGEIQQGLRFLLDPGLLDLAPTLRVDIELFNPSGEVMLTAMEVVMGILGEGCTGTRQTLDGRRVDFQLTSGAKLVLKAVGGLPS